MSEAGERKQAKARRARRRAIEGGRQQGETHEVELAEAAE